LSPTEAVRELLSRRLGGGGHT